MLFPSYCFGLLENGTQMRVLTMDEAEQPYRMVGALVGLRTLTYGPYLYFRNVF
jgi:hypothetical protein